MLSQEVMNLITGSVTRIVLAQFPEASHVEHYMIVKHLIKKIEKQVEEIDARSPAEMLKVLKNDFDA